MSTSTPALDPARSRSWQHQLDRAIDRRFEQMVALRRHLHAHPEPSGAEYDTTLHLYQLLGNERFEPRMGPDGRGVIVDPADPHDAPRIALRADIDALHIHDQKQVSYCSQTPGVMHACGHDAHTATVFGAILGLRDLHDEGDAPWWVNWRAIFQPAEETCQGAREMIEAGALAEVEAIIATHMDPTRQVGRIGISSGVLTANCDAMRFVIHGRGGHAARPHETVDPIAAAAQLISSMYLFVPRATDSQDAVVVTIGQILGGDNPNVIPEQIELRGTLRTLDRQVRQRTVDHLRQLARGIAETSGSQIEVHFDLGVASVVNDPQITKLMSRAAIEVLGEGAIQVIPRPSMGSEDFAMYLEHLPGAMFRLGSASQAAGNSSLHTPLFDVDERALAHGAKILARTAVLWSDPQSRSRLPAKETK